MEHSEPEFSNAAISVEELPDYAEVELNPVANGYYLYALVSAAWFWPFVATLNLAADRMPWFDWFAGPRFSAVLLAITVPSLVLAWLDAQHRHWVVRQHDLIYQWGVVWRRTVILPFSRIQHVETASGPIERLLGLMRLQFYTAGGAAADLVVVGLNADQALRVRSYVLDQLRHHDQHEAD